MSVSASGSNTNNPFAYLQSLWQQTSSASGTQTQSDPLASLLAALDQQGSSASGTSGTTSGSTLSGTGAGSTEPQFGPQTLQALLALQANGSSSQSLLSEFANAANAVDPSSAVQGSQSQSGNGHHHHHHMDSANNTGAGGAGGGQNALSILAGATSQSTTNANGSTTTSITYANGSSVSMTTAAPGASTASDGSSSSAGAANVSGNNFIEQLIQMQAQLLSSSTTQSVATA